MLLPKERIVSRVDSVWNLSYEQGNIGTLFITNVRVAWFANLASNYNVSIPYMQIASITCVQRVCKNNNTNASKQSEMERETVLMSDALGRVSATPLAVLDGVSSSCLQRRLKSSGHAKYEML